MEDRDRIDRETGYVNRRSFLRLSGILGIGLASAAAVPAWAESLRFNRKLYKVSKTRLAMGTFVSMTLLHPSRDRAEEAMGEAFLEIDSLSRAISRFDNTTAVSELNREGYLRDVPPEMAEVVGEALRYYRISNGAFDITVKPVVDLFKEKFAQEKGAPPSEGELRKALGLVNGSEIAFSGSTLRFKRPGMGITLDGIAKGYIVDRASRVLARYGIRNHLINAGGDIRTAGHGQGRRPWTIAIQDPQKKRHYPDIIQMTDGAIATSGNYEIYFDREKMFHHIVDPLTGLSPEESVSVSVRAETAMAADALSTSVFVLNPRLGTRFINSLPRCESLVITRGMRKIRSAGWKGSAARKSA